MAYQLPSGTKILQGDILNNVRAFSLSEFDDNEIPRGDLHNRQSLKPTAKILGDSQ